MVEGRGGGKAREREGLRRNEGAHCVEKEIENVSGSGVETLHATPPHPPMYVCASFYYVLMCTVKAFVYMFSP